jgi:catechol 2,3-dioxygenase-like lactoylglutathione lyase family enzyme
VLVWFAGWRDVREPCHDRGRDDDRAISFFAGALGFELAEDSTAVTNDGRPKRGLSRVVLGCREDAPFSTFTKSRPIWEE